jgi:D-alanyl-D-alanine carboxypeptidase
MVWVHFEARYGLRCCLLALAAVAAALTFSSDAALARYQPVYQQPVHYIRVARVHRHAHSDDYDPPYASIVVDGNSGDVLQATAPDAARHPASLTKVMTLYLLFERLDAGKIALDTPLNVSQHAADQDPTKLDLKPGDTITVENAIKGIVTRSANDAAVAVAENLGGDETSFAKLMTQKAHALGMAHTTYVNASGLPDDDQITTARDQALLGRAIQDRFPRYYKYFSIDSFAWHGEEIRNHDRLLGSVDGVDGIKTGFTQASGFNLLTSVHRDGRYLVAVVMGGYSAGQRDARMRDLINGHIKEAALHRTAPLIADAAEHRDSAPPVAFTKAPMVAVAMAANADTASTASVDTHAAKASDPMRPLLVRTIPYRTAPVQTASLTPMPMLVPVTPSVAPPAAPAAPPASPAAPAQVSVQTRPAGVPPSPQPAPAVVADATPVMPAVPAVPVVDLKAAAKPADAAQPKPVKATAFANEPAKPADLIEVVPAKPNPAAAAPAQADAETDTLPVAPAKAELADAEPPKAEPPIASVPPAHAHGGWLIQIGAFEDEGDAKQHLSAAQTKLHQILAAADPFTERILKGAKAYFRARFAGFDRATAEAACRLLKRNDFECMAVRD